MIEETNAGNMASTPETESTSTVKTRQKNDPRDEEFIIEYDKANFSKGDQEGGIAEFYQLVSVVIGMVAFLMKQKWACWVALFFYYTSSINARSDSRL